MCLLRKSIVSFVRIVRCECESAVACPEDAGGGAKISDPDEGQGSAPATRSRKVSVQTAFTRRVLRRWESRYDTPSHNLRESYQDSQSDAGDTGLYRQCYENVHKARGERRTATTSCLYYNTGLS